jgi:hypothetical protein
MVHTLYQRLCHSSANACTCGATSCSTISYCSHPRPGPRCAGTQLERVQELKQLHNAGYCMDFNTLCQRWAAAGQCTYNQAYIHAGLLQGELRAVQRERRAAAAQAAAGAGAGVAARAAAGQCAAAAGASRAGSPAGRAAAAGGWERTGHHSVWEASADAAAAQLQG